MKYTKSTKKRTWTVEALKAAVETSTSVRQVIGKLGLKEAGGNYDQMNRYISEYGLNIAHFKGQGWNKGLTGIGVVRVALEDILQNKFHIQSYALKKRLFKTNLKPQYCEECGWAKRSEDGRLPLELDHINGNKYDNRLENLRILCPNCHSLKLTHRGTKNRGKFFGKRMAKLDQITLKI